MGIDFITENVQNYIFKTKKCDSVILFFLDSVGRINVCVLYNKQIQQSWPVNTERVFFLTLKSSVKRRTLSCKDPTLLAE